MNPREQHDAVLAKARELATKADGRDFTPDELAAAAELQRQAIELEPKVKQWEADQATKAFIADLGIGHSATPAPGSDAQPIATSGTKQPSAKAEPPGWATKNRRGSGWAKATTDLVEKVSHASGVKALVSGSIDVSSPIFGEITRIPEYPLTVLDLLVDRQLITSNEFSFVRQTTRTNNAAPVADGAVKPTSIYTVTEVSDRVRVVAHISEPVPERLFSDHADLGDFLDSEMENGLRLAVENQIISGSGAGENMRGLLNTSGVLVQAWSTNLLTTMRKASTALLVTGEVPNAWAIHPSDVEALDLLQDNEARHYFAGPQQQLTNTNPVWSLPIVQTLAVTAGSAVLGDWNYLRLIVREDSKLDVDRSGDNFQKNLVTTRLEGRYGVAVRRPGAFIQVDLAA